MSISKQIILSSSIVAILALLAGYMAWKHTSTLERELERNKATSEHFTIALGQIQTDFSQTHQWFIEKGSPQEWFSIMSSLESHLSEFEKIIPEHAEKILKLKKEYDVFREENSFAMGNFSYEEVEHINYLKNKLLFDVFSAQHQSFENNSEKITTEIRKLNLGFSLICLLTFCLAIGFGLLIARSLSKSLLELETVASKIQEGNFNSSIDSSSDNEFGQLANTFNLLAVSVEQSKMIQQQNETFEELNLQLKKKNDSLDSFVYRVSHDLKAPLINLISLLKIVKKSVKKMEDPAVDRAIGFMENNSSRLQQTIHDLIEVSRIERNLYNEKEWISITDVVSNVIQEHAEEISETKTEIDLSCKVREVHFSKINFKNIISNIISNCMKFRNPQNKNKIFIESFSDMNFTFIRISDNGIGIDLDRFSKKLFGIFNRFHNHVEGSGVGLYIVKKLVEENGGEVKIESEVNSGTSFLMSFPNPETELNTSITGELSSNQ